MLYNRHKISWLQMGFIIISAVVGSAIVYIPNPVTSVAGNDSWISFIVSICFGTGMLAVVLYLDRTFKGVSLIDYSRKLIGTVGASFVAVLFMFMLLFAIPAINVGITDFMITAMMDRTPPYVFSSITLIISALTVRAGISVMARMFFLLSVLMLIFSITVLFLSIPVYEGGRLLPLIDKGFKPILHGIFITSGFPFGEIVMMTMLLPFVNRSEHPKQFRTLYWAYLFSGSLLLLSTICSLMTYGEATGYFKYSLYTLASEILIIDIFQRLEAIIGIVLIVGSYMKETIFLFVLNQIIVQIFKLPNDRIVILPLTIVCIFLALTMFSSPASFQEQVYIIWPFMVIFGGCGIVLILALITLFKRKIKLKAGELS